MPGLRYPGAGEPSPSEDEVFNLTSAPHGGWTSPQTPKAVYYNGTTYWTHVRGDTGALVVGSYDHSTEAVVLTQIDTMGGDVDDHNNGAILVRDSDHRILVAYCLHGGPNMFLAVSTNPEDISSFAASVNLDSSIGGSNYTYPALFQLTDQTNDPIYLFYRDQNGSTGRLGYSKSTDGGSTWSARTLVMTAASTNRAYWYLAGDTERVDVMTTDRDAYGAEGAVDVGHMWMDGADDKWYTSADVEITASKPFTHSELTQLETNVTGSLAVDGRAGTNPIFTYFVDNGDSTVTAKYARWDGSSWDKGTIYTGGHLELDRFYGFLAINPADDEEVFSGVRTGVETSELRSYTSGDLGATWDGGTDVTAGSGDYNVAAVAPVRGVSTMPVMWLRGTFESSFDFSFGIKGLRR